MEQVWRGECMVAFFTRQRHRVAQRAETAEGSELSEFSEWYCHRGTEGLRGCAGGANAWIGCDWVASLDSPQRHREHRDIR